MSWLSIYPDELSLEARRLDCAFWSSILERHQNIRQKLPRRADKVIGADLFNSLYHWEPRVKDDAPEPAVAEFINQLQDRQAFKNLRKRTMGDKNLSAACSIQLYADMMQPRGKADSDLKTIADLKHNTDTFDVMTDADNEVMQEAITGMKETAQALADKMKSQGKIQIGKLPTPDTMSNTEVEQVKRAKERGLNQAINGLIEDLDVAEQFAEYDADGEGKGWSQGGEATEYQLKLMLDTNNLAQRKQLRSLMRIVGRMKLVVQQQKSLKPKTGPPPMGLTVGNDLSSLLATELVNLSDPDLEDIFYQRYLDSSLLQYDHKEKPREGKGPFICCVDISGSMRGLPQQYALAMFASMTKIAMEQNRKVILIYFASYAAKPLLVEDSSSLVHALQARPKVGGGTDFQQPLTDALNLIKGSMKQADIVLITDGICRVTSQWVKEYSEQCRLLNVRTTGIQIGRRRGWTPDVKQVLDSAIDVSLTGEMSDLEWFKEAVTPLL
jgi:uncharacterized protein with von Willebrand factor type A (vWA) domain